MDAEALAELARNRGLRLKRSRVRTVGKPGFGMFGLTDADGTAGGCSASAASARLRASADEIETYLRGLERNDWRKSLRAAGASAPPGRSEARRRGRSLLPRQLPNRNLRFSAPTPPRTRWCPSRRSRSCERRRGRR